MLVNMRELEKYSYTILLNPDELKLSDHCAATQTLDIEIGSIFEAGITVKEVEARKIMLW